MAVPLNSVIIPFNPPPSVTRSGMRCAVARSFRLPPSQLFLGSRNTFKLSRRLPHLFVTESDSVSVESVTSAETSLSSDDSEPSISAETNLSSDDSEPSASAASVRTSVSTEQENQTSPSPDAKSPQKKAPLTARERLRAARVLSRYSDPKPAKSTMGRSVLDELRESEKGKKGLPAAPTNLFDDSKRGMPKAGLTFSFPGGFDLLVIVFSFVFISTVMFATTYFVWKVGAIHFNE